MAAGETIFLMHTSSIHGSFYDLFNQRYKTDRNKDGKLQFFTNLAIGAFSRPCQVNDEPSFQCLVHLPLRSWKKTSLAFKSRFEKYIVSVDSVLNDHYLGRLGSSRGVVQMAFKSCLRFVGCMGAMNFYGYDQNLGRGVEQRSNAVDQSTFRKSPTVSSIFVGLLEASFLLQETIVEADLQPVIGFVNSKLLQLLRPEALVLRESSLRGENYVDVYLDEQEHFSFPSFLQRHAFVAKREVDLDTQEISFWMAKRLYPDEFKQDFRKAIKLYHASKFQGDEKASTQPAKRMPQYLRKHVVYTRNSAAFEGLQLVPSTYAEKDHKTIQNDGLEDQLRNVANLQDLETISDALKEY